MKKIVPVPLAPTCCKCLARPTLFDVLGFGWCSDHEHYHRLMNLLEQYNWPFLDCIPYAIAPDKWCATQQVILGRDEVIWHALAYIDYLISEEELRSSI